MGYNGRRRKSRLALAALVRRKQVTPLELVEGAITRIERLNPALNAVITTMYDSAREDASALYRMALFAVFPSF